MIIGLLDVKWETRHGCSLGLMGLISGLGLGGLPGPDPDPPMGPPTSADRDLGPNIGISIESPLSRYDGEGALNSNGDDDGDGHGDENRLSDAEVSPSPYSEPPPSSLLCLPQYLVEDIICTGLCLLMLDRFIDLHSSSSISMSPAKEVRLSNCYSIPYCRHPHSTFCSHVVGRTQDRYRHSFYPL
jgi:hypothetical protein